MKILSLNSKYTNGINRIAFNLDGEPTEAFMKGMLDGLFEFKATGSVLIVEWTASGEANFNAKFFAKTQSKLDAAQQLLDKEVAERHRLQQAIAADMGLPLV